MLSLVIGCRMREPAGEGRSGMIDADLFAKAMGARITAVYDITEDSVASFVEGIRSGHVDNAVPAAVETMYTAIMARLAI